MSFDLMLKPSCDRCRSTMELYGSNCKHMTLCVSCGKTMAERKDKCRDCGATITHLIRVRAILLDPSCSGSGTTADRLDHLLPSHASRIQCLSKLNQREELLHCKIRHWVA